MCEINSLSYLFFILGAEAIIATSASSLTEAVECEKNNEKRPELPEEPNQKIGASGFGFFMIDQVIFTIANLDPNRLLKTLLFMSGSVKGVRRTLDRVQANKLTRRKSQSSLENSAPEEAGANSDLTMEAPTSEVKGSL